MESAMSGAGKILDNIKKLLYPRALILLAVCALMIPAAFCKKNESPIPRAASVHYRSVARYPVSIYTAAGALSNEQWVATLARGEEVTVLRREELRRDGQTIEFAFVEIAGGKKGYLDSRHLAKSAAVITSTRLRIYNRPTETAVSTPGERNLTSAMVVMVEGEDSSEGGWIEISGGRGPDFFTGWVKADRNISRDRDLIVSALRLERAREVIEKADATEDQKKDALSEIEELSAERGPVGEAALFLSGKKPASTASAQTVDEEAAPR